MKSIITLSLILSSTFLTAQTNPTDPQAGLDSLYAVWQDESLSDSARSMAYTQYIRDGYIFSQPDSAFVLAEALIVYAQEKQYSLAAGLAYNLQGVSFAMRNNYSQALDYFERSFKISEEIRDKRGIAYALMNIGNIYMNLGSFPQALDYFERSLINFEEIRDKRGIAGVLNNIGVIYMNDDKRPQALDLYERVIKIREEIGNKGGTASILNNIGYIYMGQGRYPQALDYYNRGLHIHEEFGNKRGAAITLNNIGNIFKKQGDYSKAIEYCKRGLRIGEEIGNLGIQKKACQCLYDTYKSMGNSNEALVYLEKIQVINDSLDIEETAKKLQQMEFAKTMMADSLQDEQERLKVQMAHDIQLLKKNRQRNLLIGSGVFLLLLAFGFFSRWRYVKQSRDKIAKEKDRSDNLLLNILPAEIAEELKSKGSADARDFDQVSILFTDFKEFTELSEKLSAKELVAELNYCFKAFDKFCEKHQIEKIKTLGDSYMAAGGLPVPRPDSVKNVVLAALDMADFVIQRKKDRESAGQIPFEMRAGIHTGNVVAGIVGVKKFQYDVWGDTVNVASRMESHGDIGKVNISQATYDLLKDYPEFTFQHRGKIQAKGKGEIDMYFVSKT